MPARAGVASRHALLPGSRPFDTDWGGPYDIVLLTNFLHHFRPAKRAGKLAARAYSALAAGGRALRWSFIPESDRITPPATATFALTMLATTARGDAYTFAEYDQIFAQAGFRRSEFHALPPNDSTGGSVVQGTELKSYLAVFLAGGLLPEPPNWGESWPDPFAPRHARRGHRTRHFPGF